MTMSTSLKLTKKTIFEGKINLKDFYRIIEINEEIFEIKKEKLKPWRDLFLKYQEIPSERARKFLFKLFVHIETVDKKRIKQIK
jgi:hypothetical protein